MTLQSIMLRIYEKRILLWSAIKKVRFIYLFIRLLSQTKLRLLLCLLIVNSTKLSSQQMLTRTEITKSIQKYPEMLCLFLCCLLLLLFWGVVVLVVHNLMHARKLHNKM